MTQTRIVALVVAAGRGVRAGGGLPKQYRTVGGKTLLRHAVEAFCAHPSITHVQVVIHADDRALYQAATAGLALPPPISGGQSRQDSVRMGLDALEASAPDVVLVHDAARAFVPHGVIDALLCALAEADGACPALPMADSLRLGANGRFSGAVSREGLWRVQTPQAFRFAPLLAAHRAAPPGATDEVEIALAAGLSVAITAGDERGFKVTEPQDFARAERMTEYAPRMATGFDVHRFGPGDHVWLCGVRVPHDQGLIGHSDADAGLHALTDALLGAIAAGDIGDHFPPTDPRWRGAASDRFLAHAAELVRARGGRIDHVDVTLICERPKVGPHRAAMRERIAAILGIAADQCSVKATTTEMLGFTGRREGLAAMAAATVSMPATGGERA